SNLQEASMKASKYHQYCYAVAGAMVLSAVAMRPVWAQTTLQLINEYPSTSITAAADLKFAEAVQAQSGGELKIETLQEKNNPYKGGDQVDAISQGKVQMGTLFGGVLG